MKKVQIHFYIPELIQLAIHHTHCAIEMLQDLEANTSKKVHELRVVCKRLRSYHRSFKPLLPDKSVSSRHDKVLKGVAESLSQNRESYVNFKLIGSFEESTEDPQNKAFFNQLKAQFDSLVISDVIDKTDLLVAFEAENVYWKSIEIDSLALDKACQGLEQTYDKARKLAKIALKHSLSMEETHQWRKWSKYFMYQLEPIINKSNKQLGYVKALETLTNAQGKLHDLHVLQQIVQGEKLSLEENNRVLNDLQKRQITLEAKIIDGYHSCFPGKRLDI